MAAEHTLSTRAPPAQNQSPPCAIRQLHCTQRQIIAFTFPPCSQPPPAEVFSFSFYFLLNTTCLSAFQFCAKSYQVLLISVDGKTVPPLQPLRFLPVLNCFDLQSERFNWRGRRRMKISHFHLLFLRRPRLWCFSPPFALIALRPSLF